MSLNIKSEDAHRLARELSILTGESITVAVTEAIREKITRLKTLPAESRAERLLSIGADCAVRLRDPYLTIDHGALLYDDAGLPK